MVENINGKDTIFGQEILQLKTHKVNKRLLMLESFFDNQDKVHLEVKDKKLQELKENNLGTNESPKRVYIGKTLSLAIRNSLVDLLRKFRHVFACSYDDLKAYREELFQYVIPLKENVKPFRQNKGLFNSTLAQKMQEELRSLSPTYILHGCLI